MLEILAGMALYEAYQGWKTARSHARTGGKLSVRPVAMNVNKGKRLNGIQVSAELHNGSGFEVSLGKRCTEVAQDKEGNFMAKQVLKGLEFSIVRPGPDVPGDVVDGEHIKDYLQWASQEEAPEVQEGENG